MAFVDEGWLITSGFGTCFYCFISIEASSKRWACFYLVFTFRRVYTWYVGCLVICCVYNWFRICVCFLRLICSIWLRLSFLWSTVDEVVKINLICSCLCCNFIYLLFPMYLHLSLHVVEWFRFIILVITQKVNQQLCWTKSMEVRRNIALPLIVLSWLLASTLLVFPLVHPIFAGLVLLSPSLFVYTYISHSLTLEDNHGEHSKLSEAVEAHLIH